MTPVETPAPHRPHTAWNSPTFRLPYFSAGICDPTQGMLTRLTTLPYLYGYSLPASTVPYSASKSNAHISIQAGLLSTADTVCSEAVSSYPTQPWTEHLRGSHWPPNCSCFNFTTGLLNVRVMIFLPSR